MADTTRAVDFLNGQPGVSTIGMTGNCITFDLLGGDNEQRDLLRRMIEAGMDVTAFAPATQNLEQLYFAEQAS
jgi:hypothetical protein